MSDHVRMRSGIPVADALLQPQPQVGGALLRGVERHPCLAGHAPHHRQRPPAGHQVAPVRLHRRRSGDVREEPPGADDARHHAGLDQMRDPPVGGIEVRGVDAGEALVPGEARLVAPAFVERRHVRIQAGDDLHHGEALGGPVGGEPVHVLRPAQPFGEAHPPRVRQPEERRAVGVLQVRARRIELDRAVAEQRVLRSRLDHAHRAGAAVQAAVLRIRALGAEPVLAHLARRVAHAPPPAAGPERRHAQLAPRRGGEDERQVHLPPRAVVLGHRAEAPLGDAVARGGGGPVGRWHAGIVYPPGSAEDDPASRPGPPPVS